MRGYHKSALAHSSSCLSCIAQIILYFIEKQSFPLTATQSGMTILNIYLYLKFIVPK